MRPARRASIGRPCLGSAAGGWHAAVPAACREVPRRCRFARSSSPHPRSRCSAAPAQAFTLDVLHFNDFHSRVESINAFDSTCSDEDEAAGDCFGGAARLKTAIDAARDGDRGRRRQRAGAERRRRVPGLAVLHHRAGAGRGGDDEPHRRSTRWSTATTSSTSGRSRWRSSSRRRTSRCSRATSTSRATTCWRRSAEDHLVLEVGGEKVAILGATTPDTVEISSPGPTVSFREPVAYLTGQVAALEAEGVDKIILLSHLGVADDIAVAEAVPGIDLIVGGHDHALFSNDGEAPHAYPLMVAGPDGREVPIVQAGAYSKYLGHDHARVRRCRGRHLGDRRHHAARQERDARPRGAGADRGAGGADRGAEGAQGRRGRRRHRRQPRDLPGARVPDGQPRRRRHARPGEGPGGDDRAAERRRPAGPRSGRARSAMGDVLAVLPFQNTLSTFNIAGRRHRRGARERRQPGRGGRRPLPAGRGAALQPGIRRCRRTRGGSRTVEVREGEGWVPIDPAKIYIVATNNFMRNGGDGYSVLLRAGDQRLRLRAGARGGAGELSRRASRLSGGAAGADHPAGVIGPRIVARESTLARRSTSSGSPPPGSPPR